jgi:hypothetical protein
MNTERPYMKVIFKRNEVKELDDLIEKHFTMEGPVIYCDALTEEEKNEDLGR